jgi:hypothetical protein
LIEKAIWPVLQPSGFVGMKWHTFIVGRRIWKHDKTDGNRPKPTKTGAELGRLRGPESVS